MTEYLIKKYSNRRLYDTTSSKYITLTELKDIIVAGGCIKVIDNANNEDITRSILMQIIMETESAGEPMFSSQLLQQMIRFYGSTLQGIFAKYMEESMQMFLRQQNEIQSTFGTDPVNAMTKMTENNLKLWQDFQNSIFNPSSKDKSS